MMIYAKPELVLLGKASNIIQANKVPPNGPDGLKTEISSGYEPEEQE